MSNKYINVGEATTKKTPNLINSKELCEFLGGISKVSLWRYQKNGILPQPKVRVSKSILLWDLK